MYTILFPIQLLIYIFLIIKVYRTKVDLIAIFLLSVYLIVLLMKFLWGLDLFEGVIEKPVEKKIDFIISYFCKTLIQIGLTMLIFEMQKVRLLI